MFITVLDLFIIQLSNTCMFHQKVHDLVDADFFEARVAYLNSELTLGLTSHTPAHISRLAHDFRTSRSSSMLEIHCM